MKTISVVSKSRRRRRRQSTTNIYLVCKEVVSAIIDKNANIKSAEEFRLKLLKLAINKTVWKNIEDAVAVLSKTQLMIEEIY